MALIYPNIVPENNLRLPDALTVKHGPAQLLSRLVLEGDQAARRAGLRLRLRHDFDELVLVNKEHVAKGSWYPLFDMFDPKVVDLTPENAFWLSGENDDGDIVVTWAGRIYYWPDTNLAEQAAEVMGHDGRRCIVTAPAASLLTGVVICGGASWVRPDYRGQHLSRLVPRIGKAYAFARWPIDWSFCYITGTNVSRGLAASYGQQHLSWSIFYPGAPYGEIALAYTPADETYVEFAEFLAGELSGADDDSRDTVGLPAIFEQSVTNTSSEGVFQGSSSRS
jgi:hypothetical protein